MMGAGEYQVCGRIQHWHCMQRMAVHVLLPGFVAFSTLLSACSSEQGMEATISGMILTGESSVDGEEGVFLRVTYPGSIADYVIVRDRRGKNLERLAGHYVTVRGWVGQDEEGSVWVRVRNYNAVEPSKELKERSLK